MPFCRGKVTLPRLHPFWRHVKTVPAAAVQAGPVFSTAGGATLGGHPYTRVLGKVPAWRRPRHEIGPRRSDRALPYPLRHCGASRSDMPPSSLHRLADSTAGTARSAGYPADSLPRSGEVSGVRARQRVSRNKPQETSRGERRNRNGMSGSSAGGRVPAAATISIAAPVGLPRSLSAVPLGCVWSGPGVGRCNPRFAKRRSACGSPGTVSLRSRTTALLRGFRVRLVRPRSTTPEGNKPAQGRRTAAG